jgi:hypothetical protein
MPNVPAPQPNLDSVDFGFNGTEPFNNRFDVESLMPGVPNIQPRGVKIKNGKNAGRKMKKHVIKPVGGRINKFIGKMKRRR